MNFKPSSYDGSLESAITNTIQSGAPARNINDIWKAAQDVQTKVPTASNQLNSDKLAYTIIATQFKNAYFYARFCAKDFTAATDIANGGEGKALILQMR